MMQGEQAPLIWDLYIPAIQGVMVDHKVWLLRQPSHVVASNASFNEVVRNTAWYCWLGDKRSHYRYCRYREVFGDPRPPRVSSTRLAHVDVGCGAGIFSWSLLDWATKSNLEYDRIDLYGLDHSPAMIALAHSMRDRLVADIANYPELHYETDVQLLMQQLTENHRAPTDYIVTFGHVLAQSYAHTPDAIMNFARVITHILELIDAQSNCVLVAVDARNWPMAFAGGWNALLSILALAGVRYETIVEASDAKVARLSLAH